VIVSFASSLDVRVLWIVNVARQVGYDYNNVVSAEVVDAVPDLNYSSDTLMKHRQR
jgi:hypothetical protein